MSAPLVLSVRLFAGLREALGSELSVSLPRGSLARDVRAAVARLHPCAASAAVAVNLEVANDARVLAPGDEVALLPPVGGG